MTALSCVERDEEDDDEEEYNDDDDVDRAQNMLCTDASTDFNGLVSENAEDDNRFNASRSFPTSRKALGCLLCVRPDKLVAFFRLKNRVLDVGEYASKSFAYQSMMMKMK